MQIGRKAWLKLGLLGILGFIVVVAFLGEEYVPAKEEDKSQISESEKSRNPVAGNLDHLVFITTIQGCECTLKRNKEAKELMRQIQKDNPGLKVKNLDYISNHMEALPLMQKNQISFLPALLYIDANGQVLDKIAGFLDSKTVREKIQLYQKTGAPTPSPLRAVGSHEPEAPPSPSRGEGKPVHHSLGGGGGKGEKAKK